MNLIGVTFTAVGVAVLGFAAWVMTWSGLPVTAVIEFGSSMGTFISLVLLTWAVVIPFVGRKLPPSADQLMWIPPGLGAVVTAYQVYIIWVGMQMTNTTNLKVVAPGFGAALLPIGLGLIAGGLTILMGRPKPAVTV